ncbi:MAG: hypothetical protein FWE58_03630 [Methanobrevibacter sp.]|nr:hypothetical protein [Methanobrevibacter sp.]
MDALEILAMLILVAALIILIYYYFQNNANAVDKVKNYMLSPIPNSEKEQMPGEQVRTVNSLNPNSVGEKIKVRFKDIDMPNFNTDAFSKRVDSFLNEKSDELIRDWELATKKDITALEERCDAAYTNVDELAKKFSEYREKTNERLDNIDKRLKELEEKDKE